MSNVKTLIWLWFVAVIFIIIIVLGYKFGTSTGPGTVTGILYSIENSTAVIDGEIVKEGDMIYDVNIVSIESDSVEFEKGGKIWKQRVRQKPDSAWTEPD